MKTSLLCCLLALVLTPALCEDQVFNYPEKKPIFSITFPETWKIETGDGSLSASSKDELVNMELMALDADEAATALDDAKESLEEELKGIKWDGEPEKGELKNFNVTVLNGSVSLEGVKMAVNCLVFAPKEGQTFFMLFNVVPFQSLKEHGDEISKVVDSIKGK
ncbi:hypothetical protein [Prosthecobacter sp.]|uniref:hypothetical protein n=1 Tax=Prosthecobacter sp. TaxID=1965333 RepID=UPI0024879410|nr:hypothetical protein [Prosthecobacter sp.]MDI1314643.1 hypothetical protein [Prosthecobacter sp.]